MVSIGSAGLRECWSQAVLVRDGAGHRACWLSRQCWSRIVLARGRGPRAVIGCETVFAEAVLALGSVGTSGIGHQHNACRGQCWPRAVLGTSNAWPQTKSVGHRQCWPGIVLAMTGLANKKVLAVGRVGANGRAPVAVQAAALAGGCFGMRASDT